MTKLENCKQHNIIKIGQIDFDTYREMCTICKTIFLHNMKTGEIKAE